MDFKFEKEFLLLLGINLIFAFILFSLISELQSMPSPIYGGDYYHQLGQINHMYESDLGSWISTSNGIGSRPAYFILYGVLVTVFGKLLLLDPISAIFNFNYILLFASSIVTYVLIKEVSKKPKLALIGSLLFVNYLNFPILKYTEFTKFLMFPIFLLSVYYFLKNQNLKNSIFAAASYGLMGLSHSSGFVVATLFLGLMTLYLLVRSFNKEKIIEEFQKNKFLFVPLILGFIISQIYWFEPIFIFGGKTLLRSEFWSLEDLTGPYGMEFLISTITSNFFNFSSIYTIALTILTYLGIYSIYKSLKSSKSKDEILFVLFFGILVLALVFSYLLTIPLFDMNLTPSYIRTNYLPMFMVFLAVIGLNFLMELKPKYSIVFVALISLVLLFHLYTSADSWNSNQWYDTGKLKLPDVYLSLQSHLFENSHVDDVILTTNELGFAINSVSGRKLVISRRAQNDPFVDFDSNQMDAAIIFYGDNLNQRIDLLKKHDVEYMYFDVAWFSTEYNFDESGQAVNYIDPQLVFYSKEKEQLLNSAGVETSRQYGFVDPAFRGDSVEQHDLLFITPSNYEFNGFGPWDSQIDQFLTPVWTYEENGQNVAALYKVNLE